MATELFTAIVEAIKLAPRYLAPVGMVAGLLLFLPEQYLQVLGITQLAEDYRPILGLTFLFCLAVVAIAVLKFIASGPLSLYYRWRRKRYLKDRLSRLTEDEKQILRFYISKQTRTNVLRVDDGVVQGLVADRIIFRSANMGNVIEGFAHNIADGAWQVLNEDHSLLDGTTNFYRTDKDRGLY
ncbi:superinfection exclusion B family protein [Variovorax arabinosiphilus]|uniref:superinfection exclusion B family protein n=1 Tax=Variovorax arabinosiphilus TaxID=3053498 RepID=UPI002577D290|nr:MULTISPECIES: superinfection exclusion B family protein [unclassified Variovorax]MDM0118904.1 superinfection exclusion B family protein [Variovorax sp. J2L1-78]MDM0129329.1 superinfection exclusion B family protein [Variovorax sp. J2L1-63]MDM0232884.1 superinfection exclusion B family protein [Variovorax sp. J2R1-6]